MMVDRKQKVRAGDKGRLNISRPVDSKLLPPFYAFKLLKQQPVGDISDSKPQLFITNLIVS